MSTLLETVIIITGNRDQIMQCISANFNPAKMINVGSNCKFILEDTRICIDSNGVDSKFAIVWCKCNSLAINALQKVSKTLDALKFEIEQHESNLRFISKTCIFQGERCTNSLYYEYLEELQEFIDRNGIIEVVPSGIVNEVIEDDDSLVVEDIVQEGWRTPPKRAKIDVPPPLKRKNSYKMPSAHSSRRNLFLPDIHNPHNNR